MFELRIDTGNAAFEDAPGVELARLLREIADQVEGSPVPRAVRDANGNQVGAWRLTD